MSAFGHANAPSRRMSPESRSLRQVERNKWVSPAEKKQGLPPSGKYPSAPARQRWPSRKTAWPPRVPAPSANLRSPSGLSGKKRDPSPRNETAAPRTLSQAAAPSRYPSQKAEALQQQPHAHLRSSGSFQSFFSLPAIRCPLDLFLSMKRPDTR